ncbi:MAG: ATP-dependent DNA ligase, partial [archaeon]
KLATLGGHGSVDQKVKLVAELISSAKPLEARYVIRTVLEDLRVGVGSGSLRDAIAWAYLPVNFTYDEKMKSIEVEDREKYKEIMEIVQSAYDKCNDFSIVAKAAKKGIKALEKIDLQIGTPIKVMLALKVANVQEAFKKVGKPADIEYKLDGFRMQVHKKGKSVTVYTRRLENVTHQFPEIKKYVEDNVTGKSFILDCEAVGFNPKTGKYQPFQHISQRIKRKYNIKETEKKLPVELNVFDVVDYEGKNMINEPFEKRRALIEKIVKNQKRKIVVIPNIITSSITDAESFYEKSLNMGNEGVMFKNLTAPYKPGARVGHMIKLKPIMETLDLAVVGAEWGTGKRAGWLTSYILACIGENDEYLEIGKVGTGFKEKEEEGVSFNEMTERLKPFIKIEKGREVKIKPDLVIEVKYEEIQKSPTYSSGFALRFPRLVRIRDDRRPDEASRLSEVKELYKGQKK